MEQEIDLRPFIQAVMRQWRLIVGAVALTAVAAVVITMALPRTPTARGDVLIIARTSQLTLDQRFTDRDATMVTNALNQRQALVDLATSPRLEARVAEQLGLSPYESGELLARITITSRSDLLQIEASGETPDEAERLAEAWAASYETFVNEVYRGGVGDTLETPIGESQQRYDGAQSALTAFYSRGDLVRAQQSVARMEGLLSSGTSAQVGLYTQYLSRTQELNLILEDARALQAQFEGGGNAGLGTSLASLAVRARLAGTSQLPVQLNFDNAEAFAASQASAADLAEFVRLLEAERDRLVLEAERLAGDLATGNSGAIGLPPDVRARYEADLATARSVLSLAESQERRLLLERDLALRSIEVLQAKRNERAVDEALPEVSVRFVGAAAQPPHSILSRLVLNLAAAVTVSLALVLTFVIGRELLRRRSAALAGARAPAERPADTPVASD